MAQKPAVSLAAMPKRRHATLEMAHRLEHEGFTGIYCPSMGDCMGLCEAIALATHEIPFGTAIAPIYFRQPFDYAQTAALIHELSDGRFRFGIGVSHGPVHQRLEVGEVVRETPRVVTLVLRVPGWPGRRPGQHVDVRVTGEDGYQAQRLYSIASAPEDRLVALTVERIAGGEVSPYFVGEVRAGDRFELRGPIGGHFVWTADLGGPLFLIAGGSGVVPLMAMLRHRAAVGSTVPAVLLYSSRSFSDVIYREELDRLAARGDGLTVVHTLTRVRPSGWTGATRRIDRAMLAEAGFPASARPQIFICGPTSLVESVGQLLLELGHEASRIKTERFGPSGG